MISTIKDDNDSFLSKSRIIYNSQKIENNISSYLPHINIKSFKKIKKFMAKFRLR